MEVWQLTRSQRYWCN